MFALKRDISTMPPKRCSYADRREKAQECITGNTLKAVRIQYAAKLKLQLITNEQVSFIVRTLPPGLQVDLSPSGNLFVMAGDAAMDTAVIFNSPYQIPPETFMSHSQKSLAQQLDPPMSRSGNPGSVMPRPNVSIQIWSI